MALQLYIRVLAIPYYTIIKYFNCSYLTLHRFVYRLTTVCCCVRVAKTFCSACIIFDVDLVAMCTWKDNDMRHAMQHFTSMKPVLLMHGLCKFFIASGISNTLSDCTREYLPEH